MVFDRDIVFGQFPPIWLVNQFFVETIGVTHDIVLQNLELGENASVQSLARDIERRIVDVCSEPFAFSATEMDISAHDCPYPITLVQSSS